MRRTAAFLALTCLAGAAPALASEWMWLDLPGDRPVLAEVMRTSEDRSLGMMYRAEFPPDRLMLFLYDKDGVRKIWMKHCRFPLDVAWLDRAGRVVSVQRDVPPCEREPCPIYGPESAVRNFVEGTAGWLERSGVAVGDMLRLGPLLPAEP